MTKIHSFSFSSQALIADPRHGLEETYWAKVEGLPRPETLVRLRRGVALKDGARGRRASG